MERQQWEYCIVYASAILANAGSASRSAEYTPATIVEFSNGDKAEYPGMRPILVLGTLGSEGWEVVAAINRGSTYANSPVEWTLKRLVG